MQVSESDRGSQTQGQLGSTRDKFLQLSADYSDGMIWQQRDADS